MAADRPLLDVLLLLGKCDHSADVVHDRGNGHVGTDGSHSLVLGAALFLHIWSIDRIAAGAVIEIGQQHVIADCTEPPRHILELLADTVGVHQEEDGRKRSVALGMADEGLHRAVFSGDVQLLLDHRHASSVTSLRCIAKSSAAAHFRLFGSRCLLSPLSIALIAMFLQQTFASVGKVLPAVIAPLVLAELGADPAWVGVYYGLTAAASLVAQMGCGSFIVRYGALRMSQVALVLLGGGVAMAAVGSLPGFAASAIIGGGGGAVSTPTSSQLLGRVSPPRLAPLVF